VTKGGRGSFDKVIRGLDVLKKHEVDFNILCTIHAANQDHPLEVYRFFRDELGAEFMQFIPIVERVTEHENGGESEHTCGEKPLDVPSIINPVTDRSVNAEKFGRFLAEIFDEWVRRDVGRVFVQHFDSALANWFGAPCSACIFNETCGQALALEHNGDLYSCDHFVDPEYKLGNIRETHMLDMVASPQQVQFGLDKRDTLPQYCRECEVRFACHGGCPKNRFIETPDGESGLNYLCAGYKHFFNHIDFPMKVMRELLRRNRAPAEIMTMEAAEEKEWKAYFA
jgi:uncharacterized protein